jgi:pyroglutamyl-peptidase
MVVLLAAFEPFGGEAINPSWEAARPLAGAFIAGHAVEVVLLPVVFGEAADRLAALVEALRPALVLLCGEAGGRAGVTIERVAVNVRDARIPDNAGRQPIDEPVDPTGPAAYFTSIPLRAAVASVREAGIPADISNSAGTYVCNDCFYASSHRAALHYPDMRVGFVHVPYAPEQVIDRPGLPSMATDEVIVALRAVIATSLGEISAVA